MAWIPDSLLPGYQKFTFELPDAKLAPGESTGITLTGTLVRRNQPSNSRAVVYIHGWNDYFFQTEMADFFAKQNIDFYALELRRYGRNLQTGMLAGYIDNLKDYFTEIDHAMALVKENHSAITLLGHSTGGLISSLWADQCKDEIDSLILDSPWLELQSLAALRPVTEKFLALVKTLSPTAVVPTSDIDFYTRTLRADQDGEWKYDLSRKSNKAFVTRAGWLWAVMEGQRLVAKGLKIKVPTLVMTSKKSIFPRQWSEELKYVDQVLDVEAIAKRAVNLSDCVTLIRIKGAIHNLVLSVPEVRAHVYQEMARWMDGYLPS